MPYFLKIFNSLYKLWLLNVWLWWLTRPWPSRQFLILSRTDYQFVKKRVIRTWEIISKRAAGFYAETMAHGSMIYRRWLVIVKAEELFGIDRYMDHSLPLTRLAYPTGLFFAVVTWSWFMRLIEKRLADNHNIDAHQ